MNARLFWLHALSPIHVGIGRGLGYIDLPIDRDATTGWPILRGSGFKGVLADHFGATDSKRQSDGHLRAAFGTSGDSNQSNAGALIPSDAKIVCMPVRSFRGTFAWVASPLSLRFLRRALQLAGVGNAPSSALGSDVSKALHTSCSALTESHRIYLEDLDLDAEPSEDVTKWAEWIGSRVFHGDSDWQRLFAERFVVVPDPVFDFLSQTGTEVHTRVSIDHETGTASDKALWTEESLPAETILMGILQCDRVFGYDGESTKLSPQSLLDRYAKDKLTLQVGGKATVGRGQVRCIFTEVS